MNKNIKKIIAVFFSFVIIGCNVFASTNTYDREEEEHYGVKNYSVTSSNKNNVMNTPYVNENEKIYDFAELLTDEEEEEIAYLIYDFIEEYNMDMAVVTIDDSDFRTSEEYADDFFDYNNFGTNKTLDGILFLIDMDNRKMWISTHGEAIRMYNDDRIESILDTTYSYISKQDYYNCAKGFVEDASYYASKGVQGKNVNSHIDEKTGDIVYEIKFGLEHILFGAIGSGIATLLFILIANSKHKVIRKATQAKQYIVKDSINITQREDRFISTYTSKVYDPPSDSSSGGGSSTHSSSSGSSHGGGGRSF